MNYSLIDADNRASFEMDCEHRLVMETERGSCTMEYEREPNNKAADK